MRVNNVLSVTGDYTYKKDVQRAALTRNHRVDYTRTMDAALNKLLEKDYLLVVIRDETVNYLNKLKIMKRLKPMPVLVLSYNTPKDMVNPMKMGADFHIATPFNLEYILDISCGLTRLYKNGLYIAKKPKVLSHEHLHVDVGSREVLLKGNPIDLTQKEFDVLRLLMEHEGDVLTYREIFQEVWGEDYIDNSVNLLSTIVKRLNQKLRTEPGAKNHIKNKHQMGYCFDPD